jgi:hypothetical protein
MNDHQPWQFLCKSCGGHDLTVTHVWNILAGPESETWQEWGPLQADHLWRYDFKEKIEKQADKDGQVERGDFGVFAEDDSDSEAVEYETVEPESDPEQDEFFVNCADCDREIEFGWSQSNGARRIFPVDCSDFSPIGLTPAARYWDSWHQKHWLRVAEPASQDKA